MQECLVHWFFMKSKYRDGEGAEERTFLNRVIQNRLADIARIKGAYKRKTFYMSESLDAMNDDEELIGLKEKALMVEEKIVEKVTVADLPDAIAKATAGLSFRQKQICRYLSEGMSQVKVGEIMKMPRATLQDEVKRIREAFRKEGLEEYLR